MRCFFLLLLSFASSFARSLVRSLFVRLNFFSSAMLCTRRVSRRRRREWEKWYSTMSSFDLFLQLKILVHRRKEKNEKGWPLKCNERNIEINHSYSAERSSCERECWSFFLAVRRVEWGGAGAAAPRDAISYRMNNLSTGRKSLVRIHMVTSRRWRRKRKKAVEVWKRGVIEANERERPAGDREKCKLDFFSVCGVFFACQL